MSDIIISSLAILIVAVTILLFLGLVNCIGSTLSRLLQCVLGVSKPQSPCCCCQRCQCHTAGSDKHDRCNNIPDEDTEAMEDTADHSRYNKPRRRLP